MPGGINCMQKLNWLNAFEIRPAVQGDGVKMAKQLRAKDRAELAATHPGKDAGECLEKFRQVSDVCLFVSYQNKPLLLAGIYRDSALISPAIVWLLTGKEVEKHPVCFVKMVRFFLSQWLAYYGALFNYVDARYTAACKLVKKLGAQLENDGTYYAGNLFLKCIFRRNLWGE